jgi:hypothetical protein
MIPWQAITPEANCQLLFPLPDWAIYPNGGAYAYHNPLLALPIGLDSSSKYVNLEHSVDVGVPKLPYHWLRHHDNNQNSLPLTPGI